MNAIEILKETRKRSARAERDARLRRSMRWNAKMRRWQRRGAMSVSERKIDDAVERMGAVENPFAALSKAVAGAR